LIAAGEGALLIVTALPVGSFIGVLADRLPRGEDVVLRPSRCRSCRARLGAADLVPVASFLLLRGRCQHCGAALPRFLLIAELAAVAVAALAVALAPDRAHALATAGFGWTAIALGLCDLRRFVLPDILTLPLAAAGIAVAPLLQPADPLGAAAAALLGLALGGLSLAAIRFGYRALRGREGLGLGDVKLMAALGAWLGAEMLAPLALIAASTALAAALGRAIRKRRPLWRARAIVPFGLHLCLAGLLLWLAGLPRP
jgi:leader peptidase (prepilin peptidase)/N-methyltransferase